MVKIQQVWKVEEKLFLSSHDVCCCFSSWWISTRKNCLKRSKTRSTYSSFSLIHAADRVHLIERTFSNAKWFHREIKMNEKKTYNFSINYFEAWALWDGSSCVYRAEARENVSRRLILSHNLVSCIFRIMFFSSYHMLRDQKKAKRCFWSLSHFMGNKLMDLMMQKSFCGNLSNQLTAWHFGFE